MNNTWKKVGAYCAAILVVLVVVSTAAYSRQATTAADDVADLSATEAASPAESIELLPESASSELPTDSADTVELLPSDGQVPSDCTTGSGATQKLETFRKECESKLVVLREKPVINRVLIKKITTTIRCCDRLLSALRSEVNVIRSELRNVRSYVGEAKHINAMQGDSIAKNTRDIKALREDFEKSQTRSQGVTTSLVGWLVTMFVLVTIVVVTSLRTGR